MKILKLLVITSMAVLFAPSALAQDAAADLNMSWRALAGANGLYFHPEGSDASQKQASQPAKADSRVAIKK